MRKCLIAGNWKMHGHSAFVADYAAALARTARPADVDVLLLPPVPYVRELVSALQGTGVMVGIQNVHAEAEGAFTGEVSAEMARDVGAGWVLAGHSERRTLCGETDAVVAAKVAAAARVGLIPILCVGETLDEREAGSAHAVVGRQLSAVGQGAGSSALAAGIVAYEPVWAIGTGRTATPAQAQEMHAVIRSEIERLCGDVAAARMRILYGGSVKPENAAELLAQGDIDGALVGGASLEPSGFATIVGAGSRAAEQRSGDS